jgi:ketosteroid isomerase-like protein
MSQENVEIVRRSFEAWNRQDPEGASEHLSPDVEIDASDRTLNPQVFSGIEGVMRFQREAAEIWEEFRVEIEDLLPVGDDVVVLVRSAARGRAGGVPVDFRSAWVVTVRDRKVTRFRLYRDRSQALEAVGLRE